MPEGLVKQSVSDEPGKMVRAANIGTFFVLLAGMIFFAKDFFLPIVLALLLTLTFSPVVRTFSKIGIPSIISAFLIVSALTTTAVGGVYLLSGPVSQWLGSISAIGPKLKQHVKRIREPMQEMVKASKKLEEAAQASGGKPVQKVVLEQPQLLTQAANDLVATLTTVAVTVVLLFFLLASGSLFYEKLVKVLPTLTDKKRAITIVYTVEKKVSAYLFTITVVNAGLGLVIGAALYLFGVPNPLLWGTMAALLNFVPYVGAIVGAVLVTAVTLISMDSISFAAIVGASYIALTSIEGQFITPTLLGRRLEMNTVVIFIALGLWAWLWGPIGAVIAVPLLLVLKVLGENLEPLNTLGEFISK